MSSCYNLKRAKENGPEKYSKKFVSMKAYPLFSALLPGLSLYFKHRNLKIQIQDPHEEACGIICLSGSSLFRSIYFPVSSIFFSENVLISFSFSAE